MTWRFHSHWRDARLNCYICPSNLPQLSVSRACGLPPSDGTMGRWDGPAPSLDRLRPGPSVMPGARLLRLLVVHRRPHGEPGAPPRGRDDTILVAQQHPPRQSTSSGRRLPTIASNHTAATAVARCFTALAERMRHVRAAAEPLTSTERRKALLPWIHPCAFGMVIPGTGVGNAEDALRREIQVELTGSNQEAEQDLLAACMISCSDCASTMLVWYRLERMREVARQDCRFCAVVAYRLKYRAPG